MTNFQKNWRWKINLRNVLKTFHKATSFSLQLAFSIHLMKFFEPLNISSSLERREVNFSYIFYSHYQRKWSQYQKIFSSLAIQNNSACLTQMHNYYTHCSILNHLHLPIVDCDCNRQGTEECNHENGECKCLNGVEGVQCDRCMADHWGFDIGEPVSYSSPLVRKLANLVSCIIVSKSYFWLLDFSKHIQMN